MNKEELLELIELKRQLNISHLSFDDNKDIYILIDVKYMYMFRWNMHGNRINDSLVFDVNKINFPVELS